MEGNDISQRLEVNFIFLQGVGLNNKFDSRETKRNHITKDF